MSTSTTTSTDAPPRGHWIARWFFVLLAGLALLASAATALAHSQDRAASIADARSELEQAQAQLRTDEAAAQLKREQDLREAGGQDSAAKRSDDELAQRLMSTALTWSDAQSYVDARGLLTREFGIAEDSQFMVQFMPGEKQGAYRTGADGTLYFSAPGVNSSMGSFDSALVGVDHGRRSYFARVESTTSSPAGASASSTVAVSYVVDEDGKIQDLKAYPAPQQPQRSS